MPPRYVYWTIILEGMPTAFRAHTPDELLPTLKQLQGRHPDVVMKWFARGRLWDSPEQERMAAALKKRAARERRPDGWRPGGEHRDPRARFKMPREEKRRRFAAKLRRAPAGQRPPGQREYPGKREDRGPEPRGGEERPRREQRGGSDHPGGSKPRQELQRGTRPRKPMGGRPGDRKPGGPPRHGHPRGPRGRGGRGGGENR
jgi:hypothetical protein